MASQAMESSSYLHVAGMVVQAITNVRVTPHKARHNVMAWGLRSGKHVAVSASVEREDTYHFLGKLINIVLPRIKEWKGLKGSSGDSAGNISFGLPPEAVAMFPEVEINYDMYPPKMIPGCHITIHTSATNDRDARLLLQSIGLPFYGKLIN
jgi:large subunit ribosomal protein L5